MEDITDTNYTQGKRICKDFEIKNVGEYHDFCVQTNKLLLADVFENFRNLCIEVQELNHVRFLIALGLSRPAALKKTKVKLDLLTDIDILLLAAKRYQRRNVSHYLLTWKRYMKDYDRNKELSNLKYWVGNNSYESAM